MNNNLNESSKTWTDPITGESHTSGNPHADIQTSRIVGGTSPSGVFNDPLPPNAVPQQAKQPQPTAAAPTGGITKFCEHCGSVLVKEAVICPTCGCQVAPLRQTIEQVPIQQLPAQQIPIQQISPGQPVQVIVNNIVTGQRDNPKDKTVALLLCVFLGHFGVHRFYEGRFGTGILWMFTLGLFGIGWIADIIRIACAPNPYYIK